MLPKFQCERHEQKIIERFGPEEADTRLTHLRDQKACKGRIADHTVYERGVFRFHTCPCTFNEPHSFFQLYSSFRLFNDHGVLPVSGGSLEQPAKLMEAFQHLKALEHERFQSNHKDQHRREGGHR